MSKYIYFASRLDPNHKMAQQSILDFADNGTAVDQVSILQTAICSNPGKLQSFDLSLLRIAIPSNGDLWPGRYDEKNKQPESILDEACTPCTRNSSDDELRVAVHTGKCASIIQADVQGVQRAMCCKYESIN